VLDYGLTEAELALPHRCEGTLTSYRNHQRTASVLLDPGEQDITHQVNFSAVCRVARERGWTVVSYATQAQFLTPLGMLHWSDMAAAPDPETARELRAFQTLIHPESMGHRFKSLLLSTPCCAQFRVTGGRFGAGGF
jgi:SAM-dependent MidA family methyltransferase